MSTKSINVKKVTPVTDWLTKWVSDWLETHQTKTNYIVTFDIEQRKLYNCYYELYVANKKNIMQWDCEWVKDKQVHKGASLLENR